MMTFGEDRRRAQQRRYLAELRISYGNAASDCNKRSQPASDVHCGPFPDQQPHSPTSTRGCPSTRASVSLSNAFSWQLGGGGSFLAKQPPLGRALSPIPKGVPWLPAVTPVHRVTWSTVPQYEKLQKRALAKSKLANIPQGEFKFSQ